MIDLETEKLLTIKAARNVFPNRPSVPTIWRWMLKGTRGVQLDSVRIGGRRYTSKEACRRFMEESSTQVRQRKNRKTRRDRDQSIRNARAILDQFGI